MSSADDFNDKQIRLGLLTGRHVSELTGPWQAYHGLKVDKMCGEDTRASMGLDESPPAGHIPADRSEVYAMYGDPANPNGSENLAWTSENIVSCYGSGPYPGLPGVPSEGPGRYVQVHREVEPYLRECLAIALETSSYEIERFGCHNFRTISGSDDLSYHSWGITGDVDAVRNGRHVTDAAPWSVEWMALWPNGVDQAFVAAFEDRGWTWGGRWGNKDPMHFQRVKV